MAQTPPRTNVLIVPADEESADAPAKLARAFRERGQVRPLLRDGSGVFLGSEGQIPAGAVARGREAFERGREYLRLLQLPEAGSAFEEAIRELEGVGTPEAHEIRRDAEIALAVSLLESGRRDAALRAFVGPLTRNPRLELDPVRHSPFVREALEQARRTVSLLPKGAIRVETNPPELDVWIDGRLAGKSPVFVGELVSGSHTVAVIGPRLPWSRIVAVPAGETARVTILPESGLGVSDAETACEIARAMDADGLVILSKGPEGRFRGRVVDVPTGRLGVARESDDVEALARALERELGFRVVDVQPENGRGEDRTGGERSPWYENWWVYAIGVGVIGGTIVGAIVLSSGEDDPFRL